MTDVISRYIPAAKQKIEICLVGILLCSFCLNGFRAVRNASVTFDEFAHLPAGIACWKEGEYLIYPQNPPLSRMISSLPVLPQAVLPPIEKASLAHPEYRFIFGNQFLRYNLKPFARSDCSEEGEVADRDDFRQNSYDRLFFFARLPILVLGLFLGILVYLWSRLLFGPKGSLLSLVLFSFSPNVLAHASLATTDLVLAFFGTLCIFVAWSYWKSPSWPRALLVGITLGLALTTKFTAGLLFVPIVVTMVSVCFERRDPGRRMKNRPSAVGSLLIVGSMVWVVFCASYGFSDLFQPLGQILLYSKKLRTLQEFFPEWLPLPVPEASLIGIDRLLALSEAHKVQFYLLGLTSVYGWPAYFPIALVTKVPLPILFFWIGSVFLVIRTIKREKPREGDTDLKGMSLKNEERSKSLEILFFLLLTSVLFLLFFMAVRTSNYGIRYLLVCFPFLFVASGIVAVYISKPWHKALVMFLLAWHIAGSLYIAPHYLAYFNEIAGGPRGGLKILADSNLDWGQQLKDLKCFMNNQGIDRIAISYCGPVNPSTYGIQWQPFRLGKVKGWAAVSANHLVGIFPLKGMFGGGLQDFTPLLEQAPEAVLGHSMYIYRLE